MAHEREGTAVKINEVERLVGITKGNIRFYEKEGLLTPGRNSENGYRDYTDGDVVWLKKIRVLRMLDVPLEEIRRLHAGDLTLSDAMGRHLIELERSRANLEAMQALCAELREARIQLSALDADEVLARMERQEQEGTKFMDVKGQDRRAKYVAPFAAAFITTVLMGAVIAVITWLILGDPEAPRGLIVLVLLPLAIILGVLSAFYQRVKQITGGEEDAAAQY